MARMGVPEQAVKNKMALEGFDPNLLDTPEATLVRVGDGGGGGDGASDGGTAGSSDGS